MIKEFLKKILTPCDASVKELGHLTEIIAIESRYERQKKFWEPHLKNSRDFILKEATKSPLKKRINILGAGILLDIPIDELEKKFEEIVLIDIVFLPQIKWRFKNHPQIKFIQMDVSGVVDLIYKDKSSLPKPILPQLPFADVTVSANLLSQLPLLPMEYLKTEDRSWGKLIIEKHLELIKKSSPLSLLLCETNQIYYDRQEKVIENNDMLFGVELPRTKNEWIWNIAPLGEASRDYSIRGTVKAIVYEQSIKCAPIKC